MVETETLEDFIDDVRGTFRSTDDPKVQAEAVADRAADLLAERGWLEREVEPGEGYTSRGFYRDDDYGHPEPGFRFTTSIADPGEEPDRSDLAHDHGMAWVAYGVYKGTREQRVYRWASDDGRVRRRLEEVDRFVQEPGDVAVVMPGEIHRQRTIGDETSWNFRVESADMSENPRHWIDVEEGTVRLG